MGGIFVDFSVVNQLNSPALNSNTFANRPAAGQIGRLFISTDTFEIYRDNGTTWDLIGGPGTSTITGTGTTNRVPIFTSSQSIGDSEMFYTSGANFNRFAFGDIGSSPIYGNTELFLFSNNESSIYLQFGSNKYAQLTNEFGNVYFGANNSGIHGYNDIFFYNGSSAADRYLAFQTEGLDRLTIEQNGNVQLNNYTTDGFLRTSGANGTLSIDTNTYVTNNIYTADGTLAAARTVNLNNHNLRFEGGANVARLRISANNNVARILNFATADVARWSFRVDQNETGSNSGSDFRLNRYADNGSLIDAPIIINRASGHVGIGGGLQQLETFNVTGSSLFSHTYTQGNDFNRKGIFAFLNTTTNSGAGFTNGYNYNAVTGLHWDNFSANTTIPNGVTIGGTYSGAQVGFDTINTTVTLAQGSGGGLRTFSGSIAQIALAAPTTGGVVTHASGFQTLAPYYIGPNLPTITNYFGVAINDSTEYSSVAITNRWGIYQTGATDLNYFNGNLLIKNTTDNGSALQVTGTGSFGYVTNRTNAIWLLDGNLKQSYIGSAFGATFIQNNNYFNGTNYVFNDNTQPSSNITLSGGSFNVQTAPANTNPSTKLTVDLNGNLGLAVTPENSSGTWRNFQFGGGNIVFRNGLVNGAFFGTGYIFKTNNSEVYSTNSAVSRIYFDDNVVRFQQAAAGTAGNAITFTQPMTITSGGNVLVGTTTDAGYVLDVNGNTVVRGELFQQGLIGYRSSQRVFQIASGSTTAAASTVSKKICKVGFTHAINVKVVAEQAGADVACISKDFTTAFGSSNGANTVTALLGNITSIDLTYDNGGSPNYTINCEVTYTGAAPTLFVTVSGIGSDNFDIL